MSKDEASLKQSLEHIITDLGSSSPDFTKIRTSLCELEPKLIMKRDKKLNYEIKMACDRIAKLCVSAIGEQHVLAFERNDTPAKKLYKEASKFPGAIRGYMKIPGSRRSSLLVNLKKLTKP